MDTLRNAVKVIVLSFAILASGCSAIGAQVAKSFMSDKPSISSEIGIGDNRKTGISTVVNSTSDSKTFTKNEGKVVYVNHIPDLLWILLFAYIFWQDVLSIIGWITDVPFRGKCRNSKIDK